MQIKLKTVLFGIGAGVISVITTLALAQANYPTRPITFVVSFPPGGLTDVAGRLLGAEMHKRLGQPIVVENRAGASGVTGGTHVWRAAPDGYTLLISAISEVQNLHYLKVPYKFSTEFTQIGKVADGPAVVLIVKADSPFKTLGDLIDFARKNPDKINFSTSGPATSPAIALAQLNDMAKVNIVGVSYRGSGPAATAVVAGDVNAAFTFHSIAAPLVEGKQVRILAVASAKRIESLKDVPTMAELGYPGFDHVAFVGLSAPPNTSPEIVSVLNKALNEAINTTEFRSKLEPLGMSPPQGGNTPEAFQEFLIKETARQAQLAKLPAIKMLKKQ